MINQIKPNIANNSNVFTPFIKKDGVNYAITTPLNDKAVEETKQHKERKINTLGASIAVSSLAAGFGVLALMKGLPKGSYSKFDKLFKLMEEKTAQLAENKQLTLIQTLSLQGLNAVKSVANYAKGVFTVGALKDVFISTGFKKIPGVKKFVPWITNVFEKISIKTSSKAYVKTAGRFDEMATFFAKTNEKIPKDKLAQKIEIDGEVKTVQQWLEHKSSLVQEKFDSGFKAQPRKTRLDEIKADFDGRNSAGEKIGPGLDEKVWSSTFGDINGFIKDKQTYQTFISEELVAQTKAKNANKVNEIRRAITHDISDKYADSKKVVDDIDGLINPLDTKARGIMKEVKVHLKEYKKLKGVDEQSMRDGLTPKIKAKLDELNTHLSGSATGGDVSKHVGDLKEILDTNKKGELQKILTIYKQVLPEKEYLKVKKETYKTIKSLDKSIDLETDKLFDKLRDLKIGSATTDVFSVLTSVGVIGWGLTKADNKDERISVTLKYGVPALGAILTSLYCTVGLISGGTALVLGLASGALINKIGVAVDNSRKQIKENKLPLPTLDFGKLTLEQKAETKTN